MERQLNLSIRVQIPISTDVRGTVIHHDVCLEMFELFANQRHALWGGDVALKSHTTFDGLDGVKINSDFDTSLWHVLGSHLQPNMFISLGTYQPPGAAQRSMTTLAPLRKSYFLLS